MPASNVQTALFLFILHEQKSFKHYKQAIMNLYNMSQVIIFNDFYFLSSESQF